MKKTTYLFAFLLCFGFANSIIAQQTINGTVTDDAGEALIGVTIRIKNTQIGTITDFDGRFSLTYPDSIACTLVVSYTGFNTEEVVVKDKNKEQFIELGEGATLDEVVVVGYGIRGKLRGRVAGMHIGANRQKRSSRRVEREIEAANTEDYSPIDENNFKDAKTTPLSTFSIDVDAASYANMRRFIQQGNLPPKDAIRIEEMINYFAYNYPIPTADKPFEVITELADCPWNADHQLLHIGLQGQKLSGDELPNSNITFLIDVSGSMTSANKLPLLKEAFKLLINQLSEDDRVSIVVYAGAAGVVLPPTSGADKERIRAALDQLEAGGSTAGAAGIELAYQQAEMNFMEEGNNRVILATDGDFNVGVSSDGGLLRLIEKKRESGVFLTVLGFGMGNYKDNKMQLLADKGNGNHAYIDNLKEAKKVLVNEFGGTLFTIAKDVKLQLEFNPQHVQAYRLIGYENRLLNDEDFNDDKKDAGELGAGHTVTALYEIIPSGNPTTAIRSVDSLKYQVAAVPVSGFSEELLTLKLRYKKPKGNKSQLIEKVVGTESLTLEAASDNFRFSAAVAEFGLLLRNSEHKANASYDNVLKLSENSLGKDAFGYRAEFVELVGTAARLAIAQNLEAKRD